jgi:hypothetical protein
MSLGLPSSPRAPVNTSPSSGPFSESDLIVVFSAGADPVAIASEDKPATEIIATTIRETVSFDLCIILPTSKPDHKIEGQTAY